MVAYNYDTQEWVEGSAAVGIRIRQLTEEIELLQSELGNDYSVAIGVDRVLHLQKLIAEFTVLLQS